jgi:pre-rRNA-processing protein TSR3
MSTPVTVIRHPRERISKCSLRHLHDRPEFTFHKATKGFSIDATGYLLLALDAPTLMPADVGHPLLVLDSTWRWLPELEGCLQGEPIRRSLPKVSTAYPRVSQVYEDPEGGLASVEAVYLAKRILGENDPSLLDGYHWKDEFLRNVDAYGLLAT